MYGEYQAFKRPMTGTLKPTGKDIEGPFYKVGAPFRSRLVDHPTLRLMGRVRDTDGKVVVGAVLDFWQADEQGVYDNDGFRLRGKVTTDQSGAYYLETVRPGHYPIGPDEFRCAHVHVKVTADGYKPLTTQLYFPGDQHNDDDHWFDQTRLVRITSRSSDRAEFDFVLEMDGES